MKIVNLWLMPALPISITTASKSSLDGNNEPYREAIWGRRYPSAGCREARRNKRGHACPLLVGIATGRAGMDHVCRSAHPVRNQGRSIRVWRNRRRRQTKNRIVRGAAPVHHQLHAGRGTGLFRTRFDRRDEHCLETASECPLYPQKRIRFVPQADSCTAAFCRYSITSSARPSSESGTVRPMTPSDLVTL
jgi:hypothetical protein